MNIGHLGIFILIVFLVLSCKDDECQNEIGIVSGIYSGLTSCPEISEFDIASTVNFNRKDDDTLMINFSNSNLIIGQFDSIFFVKLLKLNFDITTIEIDSFGSIDISGAFDCGKITIIEKSVSNNGTMVQCTFVGEME